MQLFYERFNQLSGINVDRMKATNRISERGRVRWVNISENHYCSL